MQSAHSYRPLGFFPDGVLLTWRGDIARLPSSMASRQRSSDEWISGNMPAKRRVCALRTDGPLGVMSVMRERKGIVSEAWREAIVFCSNTVFHERSMLFMLISWNSSVELFG